MSRLSSTVDIDIEIRRMAMLIIKVKYIHIVNLFVEMNRSRAYLFVAEMITLGLH